MIKSQFGYRNYRPDDRAHHARRRETERDARDRRTGIARRTCCWRWATRASACRWSRRWPPGCRSIALDVGGAGATSATDAGALVLCACRPRVGAVRRHAVRHVRRRAASRASTTWPRGCAGSTTHRDEARELGRARVGVGAAATANVWDKAPAVLDADGARGWSRPRAAAAGGDDLGSPVRRRRARRRAPRALCRRAPAACAWQTRPDLASRPSAARPARATASSTTRTSRSDLRKARPAAIPVVSPSTWSAASRRRWERDADALVAPSRRGAERLRRRWPDQARRAACRTAARPGSPPREARRGTRHRSVRLPRDAQGLLARCSTLAAVDAAAARCCSATRRARGGRAWSKAAQDFRSRACGATCRPRTRRATRARRRTCSPSGTTTMPLAARRATPSASALATGVPVLTSPTSWFEDLRGRDVSATRARGGVRASCSTTSDAARDARRTRRGSTATQQLGTHRRAASGALADARQPIVGGGRMATATPTRESTSRRSPAASAPSPGSALRTPRSSTSSRAGRWTARSGSPASTTSSGCSAG